MAALTGLSIGLLIPALGTKSIHTALSPLCMNWGHWFIIKAIFPCYPVVLLLFAMWFKLDECDLVVTLNSNPELLTC